MNPGEGITINVIDKDTQQPISGVKITLYGSLSVAGGTTL